MENVHVFVNESSHSSWTRIVWRTWKSTRNTNFEEIQSLFNSTQKWMLEHSEEILNVNTIENTSTSWTRSVLYHDQVIQWTNAKVRVYSDSVQCVGQMNESKEAITRWEGQVEESRGQENQLNSSGILSLGFSTLQIFFRKSRMMCEKETLKLKNSRDRIIFMSMFNGIDWTKKRNDVICIRFGGIREEILARTLDIPPLGRRNEVVLSSSLHT